MIQAPLSQHPSQVEGQQIGPDENHERGKEVFSLSRSYPREKNLFQIGLERPEKEGMLSLFFPGLISFGHEPKSDIMNDSGNKIKFKGQNPKGK